MRLAQDLARDATVGKVSYGTEAGLFRKLGIPTVICGPGDIAQAHTPDEYIELAQLARCERFLERLAEGRYFFTNTRSRMPCPSSTPRRSNFVSGRTTIGLLAVAYPSTAFASNASRDSTSSICSA